MKLGVVSAIYDQMGFEEMIKTTAELGLKCVEVACWPQGKAERRYAGVSHIDAEKVLKDDAYAQHILDYCKEYDVEISSLAFYPNTLDPDTKKRAASVKHLKNLIKASAKLGIGMVTTFIGRDQNLTVEENLKLVKKVWPSIIKVADEYDVKIGIENCPMLFGPDQWPGGQNLMTTPVIWRKVFDILKTDRLGINYDPSHFIWQMIDYIAPIYEFKDRIFHVHCKDIKMYPDKLKECGVMAYPLDFMSPKLPGLGDVDWGKYFSALTDIRYNGYVCIEIEDKAFEDSQERVIDSIRLAKRHLDQFCI